MKYFIDPDLVYGFTASLLHSQFDNAKPTPDCHREWWDLMCRSHSHAALAAPRGHAKSTTITHSFTLACICFRIKTHVVILSDTERQAISFLGNIKMAFTDNEDLARTFGFKRFTKDSDTEAIGMFNDGAMFRIIARGSEQKIRGFNWRHTRPNLIIGDDLENDEIVMNEERRHKFLRWFRNALLPMGADDCHFRVVGTILHLDSMLEGRMPSSDHPGTKTEDLKDYNYDESNEWISARYRAHTSIDDFSSILWPSKFSEERLKRIRQGYIDDGMPDGYAQEYLNNPIDVENALFRVDDFDDIEDKDQPLTYYISADLAISEKKQRARSVFCVAGMTKDGILQYRDVVKMKGADAFELIDTLFDLVSLYEPDMVIIEKENIATTLLGPINREMAERDIYFHLEMPIPTKDKIARARPLQMRMRAGKVQFDKSAPWFNSLQEEFIQFPRGVYKDQVDAASWITYELQKLVTAPTKRELEEQAYEDEFEESYDMFSMGASRFTGY